MLEIRNKVEKFLKKYEMDFQSIDLEESCNIFIKEMKNGLEGKKSSLKMIPTYISVNKEVPLEEPVIVMDAGGTNFRVAVVYFDKSRKPIIEDFKTYPMPGTYGEISKDEFFNTIIKYMEPVLRKSNKIGFCFSYPTEILPNKDGRLIRFSKEVKAKGIEGELIGKNLLDIIKTKGYGEDKRIALINDTVATLLGGQATYPDRSFDSYIGFILGTGTNTCYIEEIENIKKMAKTTESQDTMIINVESGAYGEIHRGELDLLFDQTTVNPGEYTFEKMISGAYQGGLMLTVIKKAAHDGLLSDEFRNTIKDVMEFSSKEINDFLDFPYSDNNTLGKCCSKAWDGDKVQDSITLYYLIDEMIERAARLVAVNLSSIIIKTGKGKNPCLPVCITAEGTTFYKSKLFKGKMEYYIREFLNEKNNLHCEFVRAEDCTLIGTAIVGLMI